MHDGDLAPRVKKFLAKLVPHLRTRLEDRLTRLGEDPVPSDAKFVGRDHGERVFRYRIGEYRALDKEPERVVLIVKIDKRSRIYDR